MAFIFAAAARTLASFDGAVEISYGAGIAKVTLATLYNGQYFGELSLFDGAPRSATATSLKQSHLVRLDRDDIVDFEEPPPETAFQDATADHGL